MGTSQDMNTNAEVDALCRAFLSLSDVEECRAFFSDLLTMKEIDELSMRLEVAKLLKLGMNYIDIAAKTGASTATISRVSKCLSGGAGGYRTVLKRIESGEVSDDGVVRVDCLADDEAAAVKAIVACLKNKGGKI